MDPQPAESREAAEDADDIQFAISQFSFWINNADTKAGLLATATTLLVGAVVSQKKNIVAAFLLDSVAHWISTIALTCVAIFLVGAVVGLFFTLRPRRTTAQFSRYSWVSVSTKNQAELRAIIRASNNRSEALSTAKVLADIAKAKVNSLVFAALCWLVSALLAIVWYIFLPA